MSNQDWERFGEDIRRTVQNAVDSQDFNRLNQTITNTINSAMDGVEKSLHNVGEVVDKTARNFKYQSHTNGRRATRDAYRYHRHVNQDAYRYGDVSQDDHIYKEESKENQGGVSGQPYQRHNAYENRQYYVREEVAALQKHPELFVRTSGAKAGGVVMAITGYTLSTAMFLVFAFVMLGIAVTSGTVEVGITVLAAIVGVLFVGGVFLAKSGTSLLGRIRRYRLYLSELGGKEYCEIKELAQKLKKSNKFVIKDIEKMIRKGWFRQGHLDGQKTCLIVSNEAYTQYNELMERVQKQKLEEKLSKEAQAQNQAKLDPQVQEIIRTGDEYIKKIRECNAAIPGEEISAKISRMEVLVDRIFDRVEQNPESVTDIRRLMEYYLPTTVKLLEAYEELDATPVQGENIISSKKEIEKTLDTLNIAFEKLLDSLFQDTAWDVASDISVLNTMLAQEGLTKDDF